MNSCTILLYGVALYIGAGLVTALLFVCFGVTRVPPHPETVTIGARILFLPAATLLWPAVLGRWLKFGSRP